MPLQMIWNCKSLFTGIGLIAQMSHLMLLVTVQMLKILEVLGATVWHFLCLYSLMLRLTVLEFKALVTHFAFVWCLAK